MSSSMGRLYFRIMIALSAALVGLTFLASPSRADENEPDRPYSSSCIILHQVRRADVIDDNTILFYMNGGRIKKVTLSFGCPSLKFYNSFSYESRDGRLCARFDIIISRGGAHCPIAAITDYEPPEKNKDEKNKDKETPPSDERGGQ